jgi:cytochrome c oxidase subunit 3
MQHHEEHPSWMQHHFETPLQQYDSAKLGMWLFLATEILLFGGLFCAYAVYRSTHPEIFIWAHHLLDTKLGAINTVILLTSSLTMAWAVRCAQLGQQRLLVVLLSLTLLGGFGFLGIKYVEYSSKYRHGLLWGKHYKPDPHYLAEHFGLPEGEAPPQPGRESAAAPQTTSAAPAPTPKPAGFSVERTTLRPAASPPPGRAPAGSEHAHAVGPQPEYVHVFFSIYFLMTGLHGLHVLAGMAIIAWLIVRALRGQFGPDYYTPVDLGGLYWHLVDLIWIFLFPLLYLIH